MQWILMQLIRAYRSLLSPLLPPSCRFQPTCSRYALDAIAHHGALRGSWLGIQRVCRCHPFHAGGYDPVPKVFAWIGQSRLSDHICPTPSTPINPNKPESQE
ncbi:MAG: membrane protein insertion efficiency factor YidD [Synechococcales cyanobacterium RU_4_20]|nr:membrane protein insertion efficiency factor YidD [Synechococcales cyanobacterium RU_4_20]NJR69501.1 membrane protein insertion efficiency factor YidD [Synechococcales cyanobacterium CRU_2_2]